MSIRRLSQAIACGAAAALVATLAAPPARAQLLNQLKGVTGSGDSGGGGALGSLGGLGGGGLPSADQASPSNTAGVLQYCIRNNYVNGGAASSVKQSVMGKLGVGGGDSDYKAGDSGMLQTGNGKSFGLGGGGLKGQVTHKVCDLVLQHAKSLL